MAEVTVAVWNLHQGVDKRPANITATWKYLEQEIRPTVALIQEASARTIPETAGGNLFWPAEEVPYETAVVAYEGRVEPLPEILTRYSSRTKFQIRPTVPATFAAARLVDLPDVEPFVAISLYGRMAPLYAQTGLLRAIADLIPLFDSPGFNRRVVLGGDLNVYDQTKSDAVMRDRWKAIMRLVETLGLVNILKLTQHQRMPAPGCPCNEEDCWHVETFRHRRRKSGPGYFTTDYLFATEELAKCLVGFEVWNDRPVVWELSDHCPLVARFEL